MKAQHTLQIPNLSVDVQIQTDEKFEFVATTEQVAKGYGVSVSVVREHKRNHAEELIESKHWISSVQKTDAGNKSKQTFWTKRGIIRLGFFIKSENAKVFRDYIEDLTIFHDSKNSFLEKVLREVPSQWQKRFDDEFFAGVMKLYGYDFNRSKNTPSFVGNFINKYIYNHLWRGLPQELKRRRREFGEDSDESLVKLHQFLQDNAADALKKHTTKVVAIIACSQNEDHFKHLFEHAFINTNQLAVRFN